MGISSTRGALVAALLAAALAACTPTAQPVTASGGQTGDVVDDISGLSLPLWAGGLRRMEVEKRDSPNGPIRIVTYSGKEANVYMFIGGRAVPDGATSPGIENDHKRSAVAIYELVLKRNGQLLKTPMDLQPLTTLPPGRCPIASVEWLCGGFVWRGQTDTLTDRLYTRGYKGRPVMIHGRGSAAAQDNLKSLVDLFSRQMAAR